MHFLRIALLFCIVGTLDARKTPYQAVVHVPVADLVGQPILDFKLAPSISESYAHLPLASAHKNSVCPRMHQALFNEIVTVIEERGDELRITLPHAIYTSNYDASTQNIFLMLKKHVTPLDVLDDNNLAVTQIPQSIDAAKKNIVTANNNVVTLWLPFKSPVTGKVYSAGTRFVQAAQRRITDLVFKVYEYDADRQQFHMIKIPKKICFEAGKNYTTGERIRAYVDLLRAWAHLNGAVPSAQGGCSFTTECFSPEFIVVHARSTDGQVLSFWQRPEMRNIVQSGFDISGAVYRAAQICGIPYFFKNSPAAAQYLGEKRRISTIVEGDIIWVPYGLFVISSLQDNTVIACCGYDPGYGRVVELPLNRVFKNINTISELLYAINNGGSYELLNADGAVSRTVQECKILALQSAWDY